MQYPLHVGCVSRLTRIGLDRFGKISAGRWLRVPTALPAALKEGQRGNLWHLSNAPARFMLGKALIFGTAPGCYGLLIGSFAGF